MTQKDKGFYGFDGGKARGYSVIMVTDNYANCYYHNHSAQSGRKMQNYWQF